ncbi:MAG: hypothetical protein CMI85_00885 [Candidatus Pelagibacter sp.]|nr:hypothetical protein [Candidatus Pelagibacter sp.]
MQFSILFLIIIPLIEIYFMIKIGTVIGAFNTIFATLLTAAVGLYFVKLQGISTLYSAVNSIRKEQTPFREILSGFCLIIAAIFLIIPGFITDSIGLLLLIPQTRSILLKIFINEKEIRKNYSDEPNTIEVEVEEIDDKNKH